ncbi:hypothetical protein FRC08_002781 [Ceratobasidium sp. 394]|nr:hypothetical protein FRC08_002781 [Ceratobasidium sp. 394]
MVDSATNLTSEGTPRITQLKSAQLGSLKLVYEDYRRFMARRTTLRKNSGIRDLLHLELQPGVISFLAGKPNPRAFPIEELSIILRSPTAPQPYQSNVEPGSVVREILTLKDDDISTALQYSYTDGIPELRQILAEFQRKEHGVDVDGVKLQLAVGGGSQDLLYKAFSSVLDEGDSVLVEAPVYGGILSILQTLEADVVEVETDLSGLSIDHLRATLESWPVGKRLPKALYTVPFGCNLTGAMETLERRKVLLELAEEYDFLIFEDDPYFFLYFGPDERPPSYLNLEAIHFQATRRQRRVLRFDSFSQVFSGGTPIFASISY